jgi:hypothetical protein
MFCILFFSYFCVYPYNRANLVMASVLLSLHVNKQKLSYFYFYYYYYYYYYYTLLVVGMGTKFR